MRRVLFVATVVCLAVSTAKAQDPVKVDPNNWKVEFENAQVRVLRVHIPPAWETRNARASGECARSPDGQPRER